MTAQRRLRPHNWDRLSPEVQAAIDRELAKLRPIEEWPEEKVRRLATLLGLRPREDAALRGGVDA